ncbi:MAG: shikimate dehydrogenase [Armatimonadetes bacterium]|nr:shikimate dehydrogenase [Armatimonadota bacterium]
MEPFEWRDAPAADFAVVGDPVGHSLSPRMHQAAYSAVGLSLRYVAIRVPEGEFPQAAENLRELGYVGLNATLPHKLAAFEWCESVESGAWRFSAVNTIRLADRTGINTDVPGFMAMLESRGVAHGSRLLFLGAGGSARSLMAACWDSGYRLAAWNRTPGRLGELVHDLAIDAEILDSPDVTGADVVVNATSASWSGEGLGLDWSSAPAGCQAFDLAYREGGPTPFLAEAQKFGIATCDGLPMLVEQGALAFEWWLGREAPRRAMLASIGL